MKLSLTFSQRIVLLFLLFVVGIVLTAAFQLLAGRLTENVTAATRIVYVVQDLLAFILPALVTAILITRLPADFLRLRRAPRLPMLLTAMATTIAIQPAIGQINDLCKMLPWPDSIIQLEASLEAATSAITGPHDAANLLVSFLIVALLTGLAEELFFRGALQRLFETRPMSIHAAVWLTAFMFALMHFQPVGALPRMLLGALFGYAAVWSGSLWTAVACHALNNAMAVYTLWAGVNIESTPAPALASALLASAGIYMMMRQSQSRSSGI